MCGIVGYIGNKQAAPIILEGLAKLEYRGYDSAGMAVFNGEKIVINKSVGRLKVLEQLTHGGETMPGMAGIGHTRWATHGCVNKLNAHPHSSFDKRFTLVHNGVIENYLELKEMYLKDIEFVSSTDSEVVVNLLAYFALGSSFVEALRKLISVLKGSFALVIIDKENVDKLYVVNYKENN